MLSRRDLATFVLLSRPVNLVIALLTYATAAYLSAGRQWFFLWDGRFWLEGVLLVLVMATGYWVNDVYDFKIDRVNKPGRTFVGPHISRKKVLTGYFTALFGIGAASLLLPGKFVALNAVAVTALYFYARNFKRASVVGNLVVASLTACVVLAGALLYHFALPLVWMGVFAFLITLLREIAKDVEDIRGDLLFGLQTLPIQVGIRTTKWVLFTGYLLLVLVCHLPWVLALLLGQGWLWPYLAVSLLGVQVPLLYGVRQLRRAYRPRDFTRQADLLKLVILGGLASCLLIP